MQKERLRAYKKVEQENISRSQDASITVSEIG
jgi:hypothetical protein